MGHVRLGVLPKSRKWLQVVDELRLGKGAEAVAASAADAATASLKRAASDPVFLHAFWLLTQIPLAARGPEFADDLRQLGITVPDKPTLVDVVQGFSSAVDSFGKKWGGRTDLGEMAQMVAAQSLTAIAASGLPSLFDPTPQEVQREIGRLASGDRFSRLARDFFARLTQRCLGYYLSRELGNHIGEGAAFSDDRSRRQFDEALDRYCWETSCIIEEFAGGWYGKRVYQGDGLIPDDVKKFAPVAFKKILAELKKRRDAQA